MKSVYENKKARFNYEIVETFEAGIVLEGWEVKSIKAHHVSLDAAHIIISDNIVILKNGVVPSWKHGIQKAKEVIERDRILLLSKKEIKKIQNSKNEINGTIVPLSVFINNRGLIKLKIGVVRGLKKFDKRKKLRDQDVKRRIDMDRKYYNS